MPQLDTSSWFWTIIFTLITLFIIMQLKFSNYNFFHYPETKKFKSMNYNSPWEHKWTKIYSPHSLPQYF
uniref:ATP synthase complex subunit 8 n=1 Tax=Hylomys suillus TaxID=48897 RepID=B0JE34_9EUTH|nr:ATP synthase F0 subunit 8 [Hylomys suillus suillus]CAP18040.1 ATPase subunit 8 [Hylomys suillus]